MGKATAPNPFAAAKRVPTTAAKKSDKPIIVAADTRTYDGGDYTKAEIVAAVDTFAEGHTKYNEGDTMMKTARPTLIAVGRTRFAEMWLMNGSRPPNPKIVTNAQGTGMVIGFSVADNRAKMDENTYATLANCIGADAAEANTTKRDDFIINPELLENKVKVKAKDGKVVEQTVMEAIAEALQDKFAPSPEILANLFHVKPLFETNKGLIDKGLELVTKGKKPEDIVRLATFMETIRATTSLKPGSGGVE